MERIQKEQVSIYRYLLGGGRITKIKPSPNQISNRAPPDYQTGAELHHLQDDILHRTKEIPRLKERTSQIRIYTPRLQDCTQNAFEFRCYKTLFPREQQYEFTNLYYVR
jgi:hypothetical protein